MHRQSSAKRRQVRGGLSLLEVVLALAILGIAVGILAQAMQISADNALRSQFKAQAQMLCESKMSELLSGAIPAQPQDWAPISGLAGSGEWYYSVQTLAGPQPELVGVVISVTDNLNLTNPSVNQFSLLRLIIDPSLGLDQPASQTNSTSTGSNASSSTSVGSTTGAGGSF